MLATIPESAERPEFESEGLLFDDYKFGQNIYLCMSVSLSQKKGDKNNAYFIGLLAGLNENIKELSTMPVSLNQSSINYSHIYMHKYINPHI